MKNSEKNSDQQPFLTDVKKLRQDARAHLEDGAVTSYLGNTKKTIEILQAVLATEIVCVLRYTMNAVAAAGIASQSVKEEFDQHADDCLLYTSDAATIYSV